MVKRYYLLTLGCPKNAVDSEAMAALLQQAGWRQTTRADRADALIVNTCGFIDAARQESLSALVELAGAKRAGQVLLAAGCLSQRLGDNLRQTAPGVDGVLGTREWATIVTRLDKLRGGAERTPIRPPDEVSVVSPMRRHAVGPSAYLKITDGCNASCAFCAIPLIKGPQRSKQRSAILTEARELAAEHVLEIILIGQDSTAYGQDLGDQDGLPDLILDILGAAPQVPWLRLMYAYPQHISARLIETMAASPQVCHYLDLPLQHAHPATLKRMRRSPDIGAVRELIMRLRLAIPDITLRTTFIVGFPGETEEEFSTLLDFMSSVAFDRVGVFAYSPEEGTAAANLPNPVPRLVAAERYGRAMELQRSISLARNQLQVGRTVQVLLEGSGEGMTLGRTYRDAPEIDGYVLLAGELRTGQMVSVRIDQAFEYDLRGSILDKQEPGL